MKVFAIVLVAFATGQNSEITDDRGPRFCGDISNKLSDSEGISFECKERVRSKSKNKRHGLFFSRKLIEKLY